MRVIICVYRGKNHNKIILEIALFAGCLQTTRFPQKAALVFHGYMESNAAFSLLTFLKPKRNMT
jgi:hypothetical protein